MRYIPCKLYYYRSRRVDELTGEWFVNDSLLQGRHDSFPDSWFQQWIVSIDGDRLRRVAVGELDDGVIDGHELVRLPKSAETSGLLNEVSELLTDRFSPADTGVETSSVKLKYGMVRHHSEGSQRLDVGLFFRQRVDCGGLLSFSIISSPVTHRPLAWSIHFPGLSIGSTANYVAQSCRHQAEEMCYDITSMWHVHHLVLVLNSHQP
jgi:hypothetical protein